MSVKLQAALAYARMRWRVFPCHSIIQTTAGPACSCRKRDCNSPAKHPRIKQGFRGASDDAVQIRAWWTKWPDANIGLATGSGLAVFDIDGVAGANEFKALVAHHGAVPATLAAATGRGVHLVFSTPHGTPEVRSSARGNVHVRGEGGYIIAPPSDHISGRKYQWIKRVAIAELPAWLRQWSQGYEVSGNHRWGHAVQSTAGPAGPFAALGQAPAYLQTNYQRIQPDVTKSASEALKTAYSQAEHARLTDALRAIPVKSASYDLFLNLGMALKDLDWQRSDGTDIGFELWDAWCSQDQEHYNPAGLEFKWRSFRRSGVTLGTVYHLAREHGWNGGLPAIGPGDVSPPPASPSLAAPPHLNGTANGVNGQHALPAAFVNSPQAIFFPDRTEEGKIKSTMINAKVAIGALGVECRRDLFHNRILVAGEILQKWTSAELSDPVIAMLRDHIRYKFGFDPGKQQVQDATETLALNRMFDPVLDYLDSLQWDGTPRLDAWLSTYMGAAVTELNQAIARLSLIAAVRRARRPGTKFDQIIVLEGWQGQGKSEALEILAGPENFSDQSILGVDDRKQQELTEGVWIYEIGELAGIRRTDIEHIKAFASRKVDRARPAYGRYMVGQPRRTVFFASANRDDYLQDETGNRRFWPVKVAFADHAGLKRDRDQIWAEAATRERAGESHGLPERLWTAAATEQEERMQADLWEDAIANYISLKGFDEVSIGQVLTDNQFLRLEPAQVGQREQSRAGRALRRLGFLRIQKRQPDGKRSWYYRKAGG